MKFQSIGSPFSFREIIREGRGTCSFWGYKGYLCEPDCSFHFLWGHKNEYCISSKRAFSSLTCSRTCLSAHECSFTRKPLKSWEKIVCLSGESLFYFYSKWSDKVVLLAPAKSVQCLARQIPLFSVLHAIITILSCFKTKFSCMTCCTCHIIVLGRKNTVKFT